MSRAAEIVKKDHRKVEELFGRYSTGDMSVVETICLELTVHTEMEEAVLYPALTEVPGGNDLRRESEREHQEVRDAITQLQGSMDDQSTVRECMATIIAGVQHHVEEEENELLPALEEHLGRRRMDELGTSLLRSKREQLAAVGGLGDLTKEELYEIARSVEVPCRAEMSKDELLQALERAA